MRNKFARPGILLGMLCLTIYLLPSKGQERQKVNLLFIMTDQQRCDALSIAGNSVLETPHLDR
ncbi:MAG: hypothetical protein P8Z67_11830, partial [Gammaproteobacteria bacterium]